MSTHTENTPPSIVRHCDVAVIGGSAAGLAAALQLARQRRSVIVIDSGAPRNAVAGHMHSFLGRDGTHPAELLEVGRAEVRSYGVEVLAGKVVGAPREGQRFSTTLAEGTSIMARRIVVATGLADELPAIEGLAEHWGEAVIHCPFCHGYEVRDQRLVQLVTHPAGLHVTPLLRQLTSQLTVLIAPNIVVDRSQVDQLTTAGVEVRFDAAARRVLADEAGAGAALTGVELADGARVNADALLIGPRFHPQVDPFVGLGLRPAPHPTGLGEVVEVDAMGATAIDGVYAAGSVTDPSQQVMAAAAHGSRVGAAVAMSLAAEDVQSAARPCGTVVDWDQRYGGEPIWSGNPNGSVVVEIAQLPPGRALDVGAGEGGDAIWLAEQGWEVTACDVSGRALERIQAEAERRHVNVACEQADANCDNPFVDATFDLVTTAYPAIPKTPDGRGVRNLVDAVAPGGTLLVVTHDLHAMREPAHRHRPFDPDAYVQIDDFAACLAADPRWSIDVYDKRKRPAGSATDAHHVDDLVLRAHRS